MFDHLHLMLCFSCSVNIACFMNVNQRRLQNSSVEFLGTRFSFKNWCFFYYSYINHGVRPNSLLENTSLSKGYFANLKMSLCAWWPFFFAIRKNIVLFKIYFKNLVLTFEIFRDKICSVIPVFTVLFLLLFFQIIEIRQCCGFTFTIFFCFLTATNALTTSWVTFSNTSVFFVFPLFCFDFPIVAWWK